MRKTRSRCDVGKTMSQFAFLKHEWADVADAASRAERLVHADARASCFYARRALELAVRWSFKHDPALRLPYQDNLSALLHEPTFKQTAGEAVFSKARVIVTLGNAAVHNQRAVPVDDALAAVRELFHVGYWLARTYGRTGKPPAGLAFEPTSLPRPGDTVRKTQEQLKSLESELRARDERLVELLADKAALDDELVRLRVEVAEARATAAATPDAHNYSESETRDLFIDLLLREAGWSLDQPRDREFEVTGMPTTATGGSGTGYVDYVLWGDDGRPLAVIEAKRTRRDARVGQQQAKLYADCLEAQFGRRPVIFYTNGYEHWLWDDTRYPPRRVQGFYKRAELELLMQRRDTRRSLADASVSASIVERPYQVRAIRRVAEAFERDHERKALLVMATGSGKTRTVIALCDLLQRCNWAKRVLFLADRVALVTQAINAFKAHLPDSSPVNLVTDRDTDGRVYASTYPTMMGLIDQVSNGQRRFGSAHFDLVIIDEAHRSVFQKYRAIFDYFDSFLVGLTATPKDEIDRNTYSLLELENGVPTDAYPLEDAVRDGYLVPWQALSVPLKFQREGIMYDDLPEEDKEQWDALEWDDEGLIPEKVEAEALNKWLFNTDTVDKVLAHLMTHGQKVVGGDRLGKTIIFAKNQPHADFIADRFNVHYPHLRGEFARVITFKTEYAQSLIDAFSRKDTAPHIAISVDMLDTGIDVPEVVNLVFFKLVRSKTKFWQMVGRGTRLCPDLFGPGQHKTHFTIFDYCQNLEFFSQDVAHIGGTAAESLAQRLFRSRLELVTVLDSVLETDDAAAARESTPAYVDPATDRHVRTAVATLLHREVSAMPMDNFMVRPHRRLVERFAREDAWSALTPEDSADLSHAVAGLPTTLEPEPEEAKRFDLLALHLQLCVLRHEPGFERLRDKVKAIAGLLSEKGAIPMVREQLPLIEDVQGDDWWQDVTVPMLETMRRRLRSLVQFIEKRERRIVYTDFEDEIGPATHVDLGGLAVGTDMARFRAKAQQFLRAHLDHVVVRKLRWSVPLTAHDLEELQHLLASSGAGGPEVLTAAAAQAEGLGLFVRGLVGLDREAAKQAMGTFIAGRTFNASQLEFLDLVVDHLTEHGVMTPDRLYASPFVDLAPQGPDSLFASSEVDALLAVLDDIRQSAVAA